MSRYQIKDLTVIHIANSGLMLDEMGFKKIHKDLVYINQKYNKNISNKMLDSNLSDSELKKLFSNVTIGLIYKKENPIAFMLSPYFEKNNIRLLHSGLIVVGKNPGMNLMGLLSVGNAVETYKSRGTFYMTNISSTPSGIEIFSDFVDGAWPNINSNFKKVPRNFKEILRILKENYIDHCFPDADKIEIDYKRFIMRSSSQEMGFETNFYLLSKSKNPKYLTFCRNVIDYSKEEDLIQVGHFSQLNFFKVKTWQFLMLIRLLLTYKDESSEANTIQTDDFIDKAA